ncbi:MAG: ATP-binding protein [Ginsengibacter sp.]
MQFEKIIAQQEIKNKLKELVQQNRLSHALLFLGKEGSGALPLAIAFAQYILCERVAGNSGGKTGPSLFGEEAESVSQDLLEDSCGECPSCLKVSKLVHADLHFSYPSLKRNTRHDRVLSTDYLVDWREFVQQFPYGNVTDWIDFLKESPNAKIESAVNKQGNISAQECDDITRKLSLKAFESEYKIMIMWMPEYLGKEGNKLLKLIEEPPPNTIFIFVAEDENAILPTILSRTQLVKIPSLTDEEIKNALIDQNVEPEKAIQIAALAEGNYREALQLLNNPEEDLQAQVRDWLNIIIKNKVSAQLSWVEEIGRTGREKQKSFLRYFVHLLEQSIRSAFLPEEVLEKIPAKDRDFSARLNKICSVEAQQSIVEELERAIYYIERNAHAKMLFHSLTIRFFHIIKDNLLILVN